MAVNNAINSNQALASSSNVTFNTVAFGDAATTRSNLGLGAAALLATPIPLASGGTNANLTASNGGILYSTATAAAILSGTATANQLLMSGSSSAPTWSTATYPSTATGTGTILRANGTNWVATTATYPTTTTANQILYSSATNTISEITTANNSVVLTNGSGVPSLGTSLTNDFTYTSSTAGTVRTLTVTNTDNTNTSSGALIKAVSGGASAGDAALQVSTTTTSWTVGVDNSVTSPTADPFVISQGTALGTTNVMSVATSGEINYPLQSCFSAVVTTSDLNVTGDSTQFTIGSGNAYTELFDQNNDFVTTGTFTAPVTGRYLFCGYCQLAQASTDNILRLNTSNRDWYGTRTGNTTTFPSVSVNAVVDMDAGDTAVLSLQCAGGAKTVDTNASASSTPTVYFTGALLA